MAASLRSMRGDEGFEDVFALCLETLKRAGLVRSHQAGIADHVGGQDGGKPPLHARSPSIRRLASLYGRIHGAD
jgi:hypothetical protein